MVRCLEPSLIKSIIKGRSKERQLPDGLPPTPPAKAVVSRRGAQGLSPGPRAWGGPAGPGGAFSPQRPGPGAHLLSLRPEPQGELQRPRGAETAVIHALFPWGLRGMGWPWGRLVQVQGPNNFQIWKGAPCPARKPESSGAESLRGLEEGEGRGKGSCLLRGQAAWRPGPSQGSP